MAPTLVNLGLFLSSQRKWTNMPRRLTEAQPPYTTVQRSSANGRYKIASSA